MTSDLPKVVDRHAGICHPRQPGVPQIVASKMLVAELSDDVVPVRCIAKHRSGFSACQGSDGAASPQLLIYEKRYPRLS